ncbi:MAG TPA: maleylpyruvate isomerase family mycothiol-dependent enzyme [Natronosporangium sp.]|nr:maleylpyruvate isomerase family mycothiol-dependent enzyme [Natronosporangium sp.]
MSRLHERKELWLSALRTEAEATRLAFEEAVLSESGLAVAVPSCPGWTMQDLVHHLAGIYLWVRSHVSRGVTSRPESDPRETLEELPTGAAAIQWWADEHARLLTLLEALDPQMPAWNWAPAPKQAWFWQRRMAHETAVHRWDAQMALGKAEPIPTKLAADGVSEVLDSWLPAGRRKGPLDRSGLIRLVATDLEQEWLVRLRGAGIALLDTGAWHNHEEHDPRAIGRGSASDLLLALYGRVPFEVLEISGDAELLTSLRTG